MARDLRTRLEAIEQPACPFDPPPGGPLARLGHWVKPTLVCEATFIEQTNAGMLRAPAFQGIKTRNQASRRDRHRHLKIFKAIANGTIVHPAMMASSFQMDAKRCAFEHDARAARRRGPSAAAAWMNG